VTTSGTISSTMQASEIVAAAMQELGVLSAGEAPDGEELELGLRSLNWMLKSWQAKGYNLWRETNGTVTLAPGENYGQLDPNIRDVTSARAIVGTGYERQMFRWGREQYQQLPNKLTPGSPTIYYPEKHRDSIWLYVWPVPTDETILVLDYVRVIEDVTDGAQTVDLPPAW
jgi:hypothetical protein